MIEYPGQLYTILRSIFDTQPLAVWQLIWGFILVLGFFLLILSLKNHDKWQKKSRGHQLIYPVTIVVLILLLRLPTLILPEQNVDESQAIVSAANLWQNPIPWISTDGTTVGPLAYIFLWPLILLKLDLSYATIRLWGLVICWIPTLLLLWRSAAVLINEKTAKYIMLPLIVYMATVDAGDLLAYNGETPVMIATALALYLYTKLLQGGITRWRIVSVGIVIGLIPLIKLQGVLIAVVLALGCLYQILQSSIPKSLKYRFIARLLTAIILPGLALITWVGGHGGFIDFWNSYVLNNLHYTESGNYGEGARLVSHGETIMQYLRLNPAFCLLMLICLVATIISVISRVQSKQSLIFPSALTVVATISVLLPGTPYEHYLLLLVVPGVYLAISAFTMRRPTAALHNLLIITAFIQIAIVLLAGNYTLKVLATTSLMQQNQLAQTIKPFLINSKLAVWGYTNDIYVQTGALMATRSPFSNRQILPSPEQEYFQRRYVSDLAQHRPPVLLDTTGSYSVAILNNKQRYQLKNFPIVYQYVSQHYHLIHQLHDVDVYIYK